jgi:hypothetical protein
LRLGGTVRLGEPEPETKIQLAKILGDLRNKFRTIDPRMAALAGGLMSLIAAMILVFHRPNPNQPGVVSATNAAIAPSAATIANVPRRIKSRVTAPPVLGYAMEKPEKQAVAAAPPPAPSAPPAEAATVEPITIAEEEEASEAAPAPPPTTARNATLNLTTTPQGAVFKIYAGVIAGKSVPVAAPLRSGTAPESVQDLPPGRYTLFFHNDGWPDDRAEISVSAGESVPVNYTFPHGSATITSTPDGAEIFLGTCSLGRTPLTVDLPLGKEKLVARLADLPERSEMVTIGSATPATVNFQMNARRHSSSRPKETPPPTALNKIGDSFKHIFGGSKSRTPAPRKTR